MSPKVVALISGVLMVIAAVMMISQGAWLMFGVVVPIWLIVLGAWLYRERTR
ncbi:hypothetical protein L5G32_11670 [Gordonia sp. HY002]|uniref:hypothetical protein n=1 Tax=Gordonia zhenghanii TaxID=2911516 RepID=UPI001EF0CF2B|nr:hypothetical protein [Gordonia zhenghanii]MCF8570924.1 hypothetical protein [Gordonia zhenghanii]MCF8607839.1 hypothetical protein [Gordonia zhenghanii]MCF8607899.1 hypothetical protein [Gordonia zhenghanii]